MDLGLSDEEWERLTPRLLVLLLERRHQVERTADLRFGLIASLIHNPRRQKGTQPVTPDEWFRVEPKRKSREEMRAKIRELNEYFTRMKTLVRN